MGLYQLIASAILFVVLYLLWAIGRWLVLPYPLLQVFPNIPPRPLWNLVYAVASGAATALFWIVLTALLILYVVYVMIRKYAPRIFGIRSTLMRLTPFGELRASGIFPLFDNIFGVIFSSAPLRRRLTRTFRSTGEFLVQGTAWSYYVINRKPPPPWMKALLRREKELFRLNGDTSIQSGNFTSTPVVQPPENPANLSKKEVEYVNEMHRQCMEEKTVSVDPTKSALERTRQIIQNTNAGIQCNMQRIETQGKIVEWRM